MAAAQRGEEEMMSQQYLLTRVTHLRAINLTKVTSSSSCLDEKKGLLSIHCCMTLVLMVTDALNARF